MARETKKQMTEKAIISLVLNYSYTMDQIEKENNKDPKALELNNEWIAKHGHSYTYFLRREMNEKIQRLTDLGYNGIADTFDYF